MDHNDIIIGKLEEFKSWSKQEFVHIDSQLRTINDNIISLNYFRFKVYLGASVVSAVAVVIIDFLKEILRGT